MKKRLNPNPQILNMRIKRHRNFPNSKLPVLIYKNALRLASTKKESGLIIQKIFARNGWRNSWRNGIYNFHHYHSITHECMGICRGTITVILGGPRGRAVELLQGDVIVIPAGVGHKGIRNSPDFECIGAYPQGKDYDTNLGKNKELQKALSNIKELGIPAKDPLFGKEGFLKAYWKK